MISAEASVALQDKLATLIYRPGQEAHIKVNKDLTQTNIILGHLGITRDNTDYYAVTVMNYILGGGGFASRLVDNIRDSRGLAYDVHSYFSASKYSGNFQAGLQTKNESANTAIAEVIREMERMRTEPVSDKEHADAKSYLTGSFPRPHRFEQQNRRVLPRCRVLRSWT